MYRSVGRITGCLLAGALLVSGSTIQIKAESAAGVSNVMSIASYEEENTAAGFSLSLSQCLVESSEAAAKKAAESAEQVSENDVPVVESEYSDIAIAQVDGYVRVRAEANTDSEIVGKLYDKSAATILDTVEGEDGEWYRISSGSIASGYVKCEYVVVGDEELAKAVSTRYATVTTETLFVRTQPNTDCDILTMVPLGDDLVVLDDSTADEGWVLVDTVEGNGYVSLDYVTLSTVFIQAESKEEEEKRLAKEEEERRQAAEAAEAARKQQSSSSSSGSSSSQTSSSTSYSAPSGSNGQAVADYACQFVGNPYVYGGTSLTNGADCSGFVMSVYAAFGISLPHSSSSLRSSGYEVSMSEAQPGDIVCYSGHVAIYIGGGQIVHASTPETGIKISNADYKTAICVRRIF